MVVPKVAHKSTKQPTETQKPQPKFKIDNHTIWFAIFCLAWVAVTMTASQFIIGLPMIWILQDKFTQPLWTCIYYALSYSLTLLLVLFVPQFIAKGKSKKLQTDFGTTTEELGFKTLPTFVDIGLAPVGYVVYLALAAMLTSLMSIFPWFDAGQAQDVGFSYFITTGDRVIAMIALVFIAPLAEEIIMRGWLYGKLRSRMKVPLAMFLVSILFGVLHGQWNVGVSVFALSLVLCSLREITGTIWSGILLHMLSNGIAFYLLYVAIL